MASHSLNHIFFLLVALAIGRFERQNFEMRRGWAARESTLETWWRNRFKWKIVCSEYRYVRTSNEWNARADSPLDSTTSSPSRLRRSPFARIFRNFPSFFVLSRSFHFPKLFLFCLLHFRTAMMFDLLNWIDECDKTANFVTRSRRARIGIWPISWKWWIKKEKKTHRKSVLRANECSGENGIACSRITNYLIF